VGNVDGVFVNNWVEHALDGFFFESLEGAVAAGNVFVNCDKGIRALNASNVQAYQNTFVELGGVVRAHAAQRRAAKSLRVAPGDRPGGGRAARPRVRRQPARGQRGLSAAAPECRAEPAAVREAHRPAAARIDANVYVRRGEASAMPMISWSPAEGQMCTVQLAAPADLTKLYAGFETRGRALNGYAGALFVSPELRNYDVAGALPATVTEDPVPEAVRKRGLAGRRHAAAGGLRAQASLPDQALDEGP